MPPRSSQKRPASANAEASGSQSSRHQAKKTRFTDPSEDPANFAESVDSALEDPLAKRKGRVKNEGYDSDSSDDGEGVVNSRKKGAEDEDDDGDDDMFAMGEEKEKKDPTSAKKKKDEFLRLGDIEGQEFGDKGSGSEEEEEDDEPDKIAAERREMGFEMSSFNMRDEMEEGKFTEDGSYVRSFDPHGVHDRWMEGLDEQAIKVARKRKRQQEKDQQQRVQAEEEELQNSGGLGGLERQLLAYLKKGETVLEALHRLGTLNKKPRKTKAATTEMEVDSKPAIKSRSEIDEITHLASNIMSLGDTDVYSKSYEELVRTVRSSGSVDESWVPPSADVKYEYKWDIPETEGQTGAVFGPFSEEEMSAWFKASYFGVAGEKVKVRPVGGEWADWDSVFV